VTIPLYGIAWLYSHVLAGREEGSRDNTLKYENKEQILWKISFVTSFGLPLCVFPV
jgi:hypothetical protein